MATVTVPDKLMERAGELVEYVAAETDLAALPTVSAADVVRWCAWKYLQVLEQQVSDRTFTLLGPDEE